MQLLTCDSKDIAEKDSSKQSRSGHRTALIITDFMSRWIDAFPSNFRSMDDVRDAISEYLGPEGRSKCKAIFSDNAGEIWGPQFSKREKCMVPAFSNNQAMIY